MPQCNAQVKISIFCPTITLSSHNASPVATAEGENYQAFTHRERSGNSFWPKDSLRALVKDIPEESSAHSPTHHHLHVLFDPLLVVTLGQNHNPTLYLVAKGNQSCCFLVLLSNGRENRVLQENGVVWVHPGRNFRNVEELRLRSFYGGFSQRTSRSTLDQCFPKSGPGTGSISITWDLIRNTNSMAELKTN